MPRTTRGARSLWLAPCVLALVLLASAALSAGAWGAGNKAPKVTAQPSSQTVEEGQSVSFSAAASGLPTPTVQWELSSNGGSTWTTIEGATTGQITIAHASTPESGSEYRAVFKNSLGEATSKVATLTVRVIPLVTEQPINATVEEGQSAVFEAAASGFPAPTVQWQLSTNGGSTWAKVAEGSSDVLTIANSKTSSSGNEYRAVFTNAAGTATSQAATLTVQRAPSVIKQPVSEKVETGQSVTFEAAASGFPAPTVQWQLSTNGGGTWSPIEGASSNQLTIASAEDSQDGYEYRAVFKNAAGVATSQVATLSVGSSPAVTLQPRAAVVEAGETAVFEAAASGFPTPTVQWQLSTNGGGTWSALAGATSDLLTLTQLQLAQSGYEYRAVFTNAAGTATSTAAMLTVATTRFGAVAWGDDAFGQLGNGSASLSDVPVSVVGPSFVTAVSAGGRHSLALLASGTVMAWGGNGSGQLGDASTATSYVPIEVEGLSNVTAAAAGGAHSLALLANGTVMAWGNNESGQLGIGSGSEDSEVPVAVAGLTGVKAISAGSEHSLALLANGTVMAWGDNEHGQLGTGNTNSSNVPVAVKHLSGVVAISAGGEFSLALLANGTVEAWGEDEQGQLGNSAVDEGLSDVPVPVATLTGVKAIAAGEKHALALLGGGTVMAWGEDSFGELGNGTLQAREETPVAVSGLSGATAISAGGQDSVALLGSGTVMSWGANKKGTLGGGAMGNPSDVPVMVSGLGEVAGVSVGRTHMLAYGEPMPTVTGLSPQSGSSAGGATVTITGSGFTGASAVRFGASQATGFTVVSASSITATAPAGTGTVDVTVTTPSGTSAIVAGDRYTYQAPPTVTKLSTKTGSAAGGTSVTITGSGFTGATGVSFGEVSAAHFTVNSSTSITAIAPHAATAGSVDVIVTSVGGPSHPTSKDQFKYTPSVEAVTPNSGSTLGGVSVTVTGAGFALGSTATTFKFGRAKAGSVDCTSATSCTMLVPAQGAGTVDVTAQVGKLKSSINPPGDDFTYG